MNDKDFDHFQNPKKYSQISSDCLPTFIFRPRNKSFYVLKDRINKKSDINLSKIEINKNQNKEKGFSLSQFDSCCLCYQNVADAVIMDCGHGGSCYLCAIIMWKNGEKCFLCRQKIREVLQVTSENKEKHEYKVISATFCMDDKNLQEINKLYEAAFKSINSENIYERNVSIIE